MFAFKVFLPLHLKGTALLTFIHAQITQKTKTVLIFLAINPKFQICPLSILTRNQMLNIWWENIFYDIIMIMAAVGSLEEEAKKRKERLKALKGKRGADGQEGEPPGKKGA